MLQVARLAPRQLGESSERVEHFLRSQLSDEGGFRDRAGRSDLYYTVFGIEGLLALQAELPAGILASYLRGFGDGDELDFVHVACLARAWSSLPEAKREDVPAAGILERIERHRSGDGGYAMQPGRSEGSAYACFLALGAYQDLAMEMPRVAELAGCLERLVAKDGSYGNRAGAETGLTTSTAAAVAIHRQLGRTPERTLSPWLLARFHADGGGFFATPAAPVPDLLSTATALHALAGLQADIDGVKEACLDFIDTLWSSEGGFYGHWADDQLDCEYTYYGLLALGHLSL